MELINRQEAINAICTWDKFGVDERGRVVRWYEGLEPYVHLRDVVFAIEKLPSAEPKQKTGHWIYKNGAMVSPWYSSYECSECGCLSGCFKYCPECGSRNRGEEE